METRVEWLNFRHLYAFWAVCRHGGFKKAAQRIHVSQSTVSEQVAQLEDYLQEELLERNTRAVKVTERGASLLAHADEIFAMSAEINHVFREKSSLASPSMAVRVGMVGGISRNFIFGFVMDALANEHSAQVEVVDGSFDELNELLRTFELDLIFSLDPPRQKDLLTMTFQRVAASPLALVGTPDLVRWVKRARRRAADAEIYMFRHPFEGQPLEELIARRFRLNVRVPVWTDDISLLRFLANSGRGLAVLPEIGVREDLNARRVRRVPLKGGPSVNLYAIYLSQGVRRPLIDSLLG